MVASVHTAQSMDGLAGSDFEPKISGSVLTRALDTTPPVFFPIPLDATVECDAVPPVELVFAFDDVDGTIIPIFSEFRSDGNCPGVYGLTRTWTATDAAGNTASINQLIIVLDTTPPVLNLPADVTLECGSDTSPASIGFASANDNCGTVTITFSDFISTGACAGEQIINRTWTATDDCGNTNSATQIIQIQDTTAPVIVTQDLTVTGDENCNVLIPDLSFTVSDNCGQPVTVFQNPPAGTLLSGSTSYNVTMTAVDGCGNSTTEIALVRVIDNILPVINCPADITVNSDPGNCGAVVNYSVAATDNCSSPIITVTSGLASGSSFPVGSTTVNLVATDDAGNTAVCSFIVTVIDTEGPSFSCPADITLNTDPGECGATVIYAIPVAVDNCSNTTVSQVSGLPSGSFFPVGSTAQTFQATDASGNTTSCNFIVTVMGSGGPSIVCPADITVGADVDQCGAVVTYQTPVASGCSDITVSLASGLPSGTLFPLGTTLQTFTATDEAGNTASCSFAVTVIDNVLPTTICKDATVVLDMVGNGFITLADIDAGSSDACGLANLTISKTNFTCADIGNNIVTLTATDSNGNTSSCNAIITVIDNTPPVALCNDIVLQLDANGNAAITASDIDLGSTDACGPITLTVNKTNFTCADVGDNTVLLTVTDANGNSSTCQSNVRVVDTIAPSVICKDITLQLDASGTASLSASDIDNGSKDSCGTFTLTADRISFNCSDVGPNTITLTATDASGNSSSCTATVTILDSIAPTLQCKDVTLQLDASGYASLSTTELVVNASDACGPLTLTADKTNFNCSDVGANTVTLTATDANGNISTCTSIVTIEDTIAPEAHCQSITIQLDANGIASLTAQDIDTGSTDACGAFTLSVDKTSFTCEDVGPNIVTLTVTDASGNSASCSAIVNIIDTTPPIAICHDLTLQLDASGNAFITPADIDLGSTDACGPIFLTVDKTNFGCKDIGLNAVTLTVTDVNGNSSNCTAVVEVLGTPLVAVCKDLTLQLDATGSATLIPADLDAGSSGGCGAITLTASQTSFGCSDVGENLVILTVTDAEGNSALCTATVTIVDDVPPIVLCQNVDLVLNADGVATLLPSDVDAGSSDACGIKSYTLDRTLFSCEDVGVVMVTLTVTDTNGQTSSCQSNVTVHDNSGPFVWPQDHKVMLDDQGSATLKPEDFVFTVKDVCGLESLTINPSKVYCYNIGEVSVVVTATDVNGNVTTADATAFVSDNLPPFITKLKKIIVGNDPGVCEAQVELSKPFVTDNCGVAALSSDAPAVFPIGTTNVTWTATDESGNTSNAIQQVTVTNDPPVISAISGPDQPVMVGSSLQVTAQIIDNNLTGATIDWGDGFVSDGTIDNGTISGVHEYLTAGTFNIALVVVDACGEEDNETLENIMVIDPKSAFVSGAGYFNSPAGAFKPNPEKEGRFIFGFIAKYLPKYDVPQGHTVFYFRAGHLLFLSQGYDWLMVDGATAEFKGYGVVLKEGRYNFQVKMVDAHFDSHDKFVKDAISVKIWNEKGVLYNNDITPVTRGYIKVHKNSNRKGFNTARIAETVADPDDEVTVPDLKELIAMYSEIEFGVYPNPFKASTRISYTSEITSWTSVKVYDLQGREESQIFDGETEGGETYSWDYVPKESTPNGVYLLRIDNGARSKVERLIYIER